MPVVPLSRTLDQEVLALLRGASLECPACGEFLQHLAGGSIVCSECRSGFGTAVAPALQVRLNAG